MILFLSANINSYSQIQTVDDIDLKTLLSIRKKLTDANIASASNLTVKFTYDALTAFEKGTPPNTTILNNKKIIGICTGINTNGKIDPNLALVKFMHKYEQNSHKAIEFCDLAIILTVTPTTIEEKRSLPDAINKVKNGLIPTKNTIYDYAKSVNKKDEELYRTVSVSGGKSMGFAQEN